MLLSKQKAPLGRIQLEAGAPLEASAAFVAALAYQLNFRYALTLHKYAHCHSLLLIHVSTSAGLTQGAIQRQTAASHFPRATAILTLAPAALHSQGQYKKASVSSAEGLHLSLGRTLLLLLLIPDFQDVCADALHCIPGREDGGALCH